MQNIRTWLFAMQSLAQIKLHEHALVTTRAQRKECTSVQCLVLAQPVKITTNYSPLCNQKVSVEQRWNTGGGGGGNGGSPRKSVYQGHRLARVPYARIRERTSQESNPIYVGGRRAASQLHHRGPKIKLPIRIKLGIPSIVNLIQTSLKFYSLYREQPLVVDVSLTAGATVAKRLDCSPPTKTNRVQSPAGSLWIFTSGNRAGRCRWSADFLVDLPLPPPLYSGAAPCSPHFTLIGSEDPDVKSRLNLFTHSLVDSNIIRDETRDTCNSTETHKHTCLTRDSNSENFSEYEVERSRWLRRTSLRVLTLNCRSYQHDYRKIRGKDLSHTRQLDGVTDSSMSERRAIRQLAPGNLFAGRQPGQYEIVRDTRGIRRDTRPQDLPPYNQRTSTPARRRNRHPLFRLCVVGLLRGRARGVTCRAIVSAVRSRSADDKLPAAKSPACGSSAGAATWCTVERARWSTSVGALSRTLPYVHFSVYAQGPELACSASTLKLFTIKHDSVEGDFGRMLVYGLPSEIGSNIKTDFNQDDISKIMNIVDTRSRHHSCKLGVWRLQACVHATRSTVMYCESVSAGEKGNTVTPVVSRALGADSLWCDTGLLDSLATRNVARNAVMETPNGAGPCPNYYAPFKCNCGIVSIINILLIFQTLVLRSWGHGLLAFHQGDLGSIPCRVTGFSHVGIVPDDAVGRRIFSVISRLPHPFIPGAAPYSPQSPLSTLKTTLLRAAQIYSLTLTFITQSETQ
ncbi:hypothetical protein PR048_025236, partial [Dryococelus australis]